MKGQGSPGISVLLHRRVTPVQALELERIEGLDALLERQLASARQSLPEVDLAPEVFLQHLARHLPPAGVAGALHGLHAADLHLAHACALAHPAALEALEERILRRVAPRLPSFPYAYVDDVMQMLRERLLVAQDGALPKIADYSGAGPLIVWIRVVAGRIAGELSRRHGRYALLEDRTEPLAHLLTSPGDPERDLLRRDSQQLLAEVLRRVLASLPEKERTLLRLHHLDGFTMDRLSVVYGESRSGISRRLLQARARLLKLTRAELSLELKSAPPELESFFGLVRSRLELSLGALME